MFMCARCLRAGGPKVGAAATLLLGRMWTWGWGAHQHPPKFWHMLVSRRGHCSRKCANANVIAARMFQNTFHFVQATRGQSPRRMFAAASRSESALQARPNSLVPLGHQRNGRCSFRRERTARSCSLSDVINASIGSVLCQWWHLCLSFPYGKMILT